VTRAASPNYVGAMQPGPNNDIADVTGIGVGHYQRMGRGWLSGTTVIVPPVHSIGGVDVRGGGPATRDTDCLNPINMVSEVDAICLSGGSAFGLDTAGGVMTLLAERGRGFRVGPDPQSVVPIVPSAALFDLGAGGIFVNRPGADFGRRAAAKALMAAKRGRPIAQGTIGAGTGAHMAMLKGGVGSASTVTGDGIVVGALIVLNSSGTGIDRRSGELWGTRYGIGDEFAHLHRPKQADLDAFIELMAKRWALNTTLAVVATNVTMDKPECTRLAGAGHDGLARAISPIHNYTDGDIVFSLSTGAMTLPEAQIEGFIRPVNNRFTRLGDVFTIAADTVARAVVHAIISSTSTTEMTSYLEQFPSATI